MRGHTSAKRRALAYLWNKVRAVGEKGQDLTFRKWKDPVAVLWSGGRQDQARDGVGMDQGRGSPHPPTPTLPWLLTCSLALASSRSRAWASSSRRAQGTAESVAPTKGADPDGKSFES